jgi:hypothetical protein
VKHLNYIEIRKKVDETTPRGAYRSAVKLYAIDILNRLGDAEAPDTLSELHNELLDGCLSWIEYSYCGKALADSYSIAGRTCSPTTLKRLQMGAKQPVGFGTWLDYQASALKQAEKLIIQKYCEVKNEHKSKLHR